MPIEVTGLPQAIEFLRGLQADISQGREDALSDATKAVGAIWMANFKSEGGENAPWQGLAEMTQHMRESQGYDPEHPILRRTGDLEQAAVDFIMAGQLGSQHEVDGASAQLDYTDGEVVLSLSGVKVENQYGNPGHNLPARPFWFTDASTEQAARKAVTDWLEEKVR